VVAGGGRPQLRAEAGLGELTRLGHVADADLPGLYAGALAFVLPSLHEGFGLTALEAMACGTPVVASRVGALPETCGDAARLVDPDGDALAGALLELVGDEPERERLRTAGLGRARRYTWERTAREIDALLASVT
jgi:glycosyltransferase involved in cell wall biosynthesis